MLYEVITGQFIQEGQDQVLEGALIRFGQGDIPVSPDGVFEKEPDFLRQFIHVESEPGAPPAVVAAAVPAAATAPAAPGAAAPGAAVAEASRSTSRSACSE